MSTGENTSKTVGMWGRLTRWRVVFGLAVLCVLFWGIHHAMQPRYQGKTAAEWFAEAKSADYLCEMSPAELAVDPTVVAFRHLGTNGVWYLWREHSRKDFTLTKYLADIWDRNINHRYSAIPYGERQHIQARQLLIGLGTQTEMLIPTVIESLQLHEPEKEIDTVMLLGYLHQRAEFVVPVLVHEMKRTRHRNVYLWTLSEYGPAAKAAVPALRDLFANGTMSKDEKARLAFVILKLNGQGPELEFLKSQIKPYDYEYSSPIVESLGQLGPIAETATPVLVNMAQTLTNTIYSNRVVEVIQLIDPKGIYPKP